MMTDDAMPFQIYMKGSKVQVEDGTWSVICSVGVGGEVREVLVWAEGIATAEEAEQIARLKGRELMRLVTLLHGEVLAKLSYVEIDDE